MLVQISQLESSFDVFEVFVLKALIKIKDKTIKLKSIYSSFKRYIKTPKNKSVWSQNCENQFEARVVILEFKRELFLKAFRVLSRHIRRR